MNSPLKKPILIDLSSELLPDKLMDRPLRECFGTCELTELQAKPPYDLNKIYITQKKQPKDILANFEVYYWKSEKLRKFKNHNGSVISSTLFKRNSSNLKKDKIIFHQIRSRNQYSFKVFTVK